MVLTKNSRYITQRPGTKTVKKYAVNKGGGDTEFFSLA